MNKLPEAVLTVATQYSPKNKWGFAAQLLHLRTGARLRISGRGTFDSELKVSEQIVTVMHANLKKDIPIRLVLEHAIKGVELLHDWFDIVVDDQVVILQYYTALTLKAAGELLLLQLGKNAETDVERL